MNEAQIAYIRAWSGPINEDYFDGLAALDVSDSSQPTAAITPPGGTATLQHPPPLAAEPRILDRFAAEVMRIGVVGEKHIIQLIFLVIVTRLFDRVVNLALKGPPVICRPTSSGHCCPRGASAT